MNAAKPVMFPAGGNAAKRLHGGFVTCTKANKAAALGVPADLLRTRGAVCPEVAVAMAKGALARSPADVAIAITGVAGADTDEDGNPVGIVYIAVARKPFPPSVFSATMATSAATPCASGR